ncbi:CHAD domain-containing protein [Poseidonocella sp. HB161398]|uniref:CYTH and CHAD domain-containing protein n=1 Tax=Poseidonocella sp. HB161398 TaxID=2320855 RepID=UPI00110A05B0|nr:CHAD domain-containing protein [Poseidonocella sp. HB161398]
MPETELKFVIDSLTLARLREQLDHVGTLLAPAERHALHSVYFDTRHHRLKKAGIALRMRRDGERWIQTVKAKAENHGGLQRAEEAETEMPDSRIDLAAIGDEGLRDRVRAALKGKVLQPVCETRIDRHLALVATPGGAEVEIALDEGQIIAGERAEPFRELELELKSGPVSALYDLAETLLAEGGAAPSHLSKSERGYLLAAGLPITGPAAPRKAAPVPLAPGCSAGEAAAAIFRECNGQIQANAAAIRTGEDPEGPHQLRIGLRRLRSAPGLFGSLLDGSDAAYLMAEAKWLGAIVGRQRDLDVALADLLEPALAAAEGDAPGLAALAAQARARAEANRPALRQALVSKRAQRFFLALGRFAEAGPWEALDRPFAPPAGKALARSWSRAKKRAKGIASLGPEDRHALRKALKRLRYQAEFVQPLHPGETAAEFLGRLKALQDDFGEMNDLAMLETLTAPGGPLAPEGKAAAQALGDLLGIHHRRAEAQWAEARTRWQALRAAPPFWAG